MYININNHYKKINQIQIHVRIHRYIIKLFTQQPQIILFEGLNEDRR